MAKASCADYRRSRSLGGHWRHKGGGLSILTIADLPEANAGRPDLITGKPRSLDIAKLGALLTDESLAPPVKGADGVVGQSGGDADRLRASCARA